MMRGLPGQTGDRRTFVERQEVKELLQPRVVKQSRNGKG